MLLLWGFTTIHFKDLPEEIPIHFNASGFPDHYDTKLHIWGLPIIATVLFGLLDRLAIRPAIQAGERQLLQWMQVFILGIFTYIQIQVFFVAVQKSSGLGRWFLPLTILGFLVPLIWGLIKQQRS